MGYSTDIDVITDLSWGIVQLVNSWEKKFEAFFEKQRIKNVKLFARQDPALDRMYQSVVARARRQGVSFSLPTIGIMEPRLYRKFQTVFPRPFRTVYAQLRKEGAGTILVTEKAFTEAIQGQERALEIRIAVMLGYCLRGQPLKPHGCRFLRKTARIAQEKKKLFGWTFAAYLYGIEQVILDAEQDGLTAQELKEACSWRKKRR